MLRKLREGRGWSQEHLADIASLSVRTVQRIESGNKTSLESLMSLASALETDVAVLKQEITVIDKTTEKWRSMPIFAKLAFVDSYVPVVGIKNRKQYLRFEAILAVSGAIVILLALILPKMGVPVPKFGILGLMLLVSAYISSIPVRVGDKYDVW